MPTAREDTVRLVDLLRTERHALAEFLVALAAFDADRRWLELGYSSLFYFLVRELGLSKGAAFYRKTAAELVRRYPEVLEALRGGKLCMTSIVELAKVLTPENRAEVLPRFFHVSRSEAREVTAALLPIAAPPLRTVITGVRAESVMASLPAPALAKPAAGAAVCDPVQPEDAGPAGWPTNLGHANPTVPDVAPRIPDASGSQSDSTPAPAPRRRADIEPLTAELARIHVTVPKRLLQKLAAARDALSHSHPRASDDEILELGLDLIVERHRKRRGIGARPRKRGRATEGRRAAAQAEGAVSNEVPSPDAGSASTAPTSPAPSPPRRSRHVPAHVWRAVWERDGGRCVRPVEGGGVCGATRRLELDHVDGFALGAGTTVDECRLLCRVHQDVSARALYGDAVMDPYTKAGRGERCSEPVADYAGASCSRVRRDGARTSNRSSSPPAHASMRAWLVRRSGAATPFGTLGVSVGYLDRARNAAGRERPRIPRASASSGPLVPDAEGPASPPGPPETSAHDGATTCGSPCTSRSSRCPTPCAA